jgi:hypothetical protein
LKSLLPYLVADAGLLFAAILLTFRKLSLWHPFTHYLFFHTYTCTIRGISLYYGARQVHEGIVSRDVTTEPEIARAIVYLDLTLAAFLAGVLFAHHRLRFQNWDTLFKAKMEHVLPKRSYQWILLLCMPIGLAAFAMQRLGISTDLRGHLAMLAFWPIACLCMGVFFFGFRLHFLVPIACYLTVVALQGYHRFMTIFPLLFLLVIYLQRQSKRWPGPALLTAMVIGILLFPELKYVGRAYQQSGMAAAIERAGEAFTLEPSKERVEDLLDQLGGALTLIDKDKKVYLGETYLYVFVMPIPRAWWPEKPAINQHVVNFSTPRRPYSSEGRIITLCGENYANFRIYGVIAIPALLGFFLTKWSVNANFGPFRTIDRYCYLVLMVTFIQVYRDGLSSFAMFGLFQNVPMLALLGFHLFTPRNPIASVSSRAIQMQPGLSRTIASQSRPPRTN